jgi:hypothetical protein
MCTKYTKKRRKKMEEFNFETIRNLKEVEVTLEQIKEVKKGLLKDGKTSKKSLVKEIMKVAWLNKAKSWKKENLTQVQYLESINMGVSKHRTHLNCYLVREELGNTNISLASSRAMKPCLWKNKKVNEDFKKEVLEIIDGLKGKELQILTKTYLKVIYVLV